MKLVLVKTKEILKTHMNKFISEIFDFKLYHHVYYKSVTKLQKLLFQYLLSGCDILWMWKLSLNSCSTFEKIYDLWGGEVDSE